MKIIKQGNKPWLEIIHACNCGCEFIPDETTTVRTASQDNSYTINCPFCKSSIRFDWKEFKEPLWAQGVFWISLAGFTALILYFLYLRIVENKQ